MMSIIIENNGHLVTNRLVLKLYQGLSICCNLLQGDGLPVLKGEPMHLLDLLDGLAELVGRLSRVLHFAVLELIVKNNLTLRCFSDD